MGVALRSGAGARLEPEASDQGRELADIEELLVRMFALVSEGLVAATEAFLDCDRERAREVVAADREIDALQRRLEELVEHRLVHEGRLAARDVRLLISVLRIAPELERSGDLIELIALRTPQRLSAKLPARARGLVTEMGRLASVMWCAAADAYIDRDAGAADRLRAFDDVIDDLHFELTDELTRSGASIAVAIEMGLVARFYERLGDHAVNVARRVGYLTNG